MAVLENLSMKKRFIKKADFQSQRDFGGKTELSCRLIPNFYSFKKFPTGIRAAFFVDWDAQSYSSLELNISHLNMVVPEWIFLDPNTDTLYTKIDQQAVDLMKRSEVKIIPLITNAIGEVFRGDIVHRIINDPRKKERLISDIINLLQKNNFAGINVDFEELQEKKNETLVLFQKELYQKLHAKGLLVTQNVAPFNDDYNFSELANYNDYIFLMAYDQYSESTVPGPISHQRWIEAAVDQAAQKIPVSKIILAVAGFGYDWKLNANGKPKSASPVTYQQALTLAKSYEGDIDFDNDSYNLHFSYSDADGYNHEVHFTDAATIFNAMRFATEYGLSGVSLWRLGAEDSRVWDFFDRDMRKDSIKRFDFQAFSSVKLGFNNESVDYQGDGEVLDVIGDPTRGRITPEIDTSEMLISEETFDSLPSKWVVRSYGSQDKKEIGVDF
jgi:peptidoglycan-N-acetylglucosamine deacetylase